MQLVTQRKEFCNDTRQWVEITEFAEAEGGYGCAVECSAVEYECSRQDDCPACKKVGCRYFIY